MKQSSDDRTYFNKLIKLITSTKEDQIDTGLAMLDALDRPDFYETLLEGICDKKPLKFYRAYGMHLVNKYFTSSVVKQKTVLRLIAKAPSGTSAEKWKAGVEKITDLGFFPEGLASFKNLKKLGFVGRQNDRFSDMEDLSFLKGFPLLETLKIDGIKALKKLSGLSYVPELRELDLSGCTGVQDISAIRHVAKLEELNLWRMGEFDTSPINYLKKLKTLNLEESGIKVLKLYDLIDLNVLRLDRCSSLEIVELQGLPSLQGSERFGRRTYWNAEHKYINWDLPGRLGVKSLEGFKEQISRCENLSIDLPQLENISLLKEMPELKRLLIVGYPKIDLSPLHEIPNLEVLELSNVQTDSLLEAVGRCNQLKELILSCLNLSNYGKLLNLSALSNMSQLPRLKLAYSAGIDFSFLETMQTLESLYLDFNMPWTLAEKKSDLSPLRKLTELRELYLTHSNVLEDLSLFSEMKKLEILDLRGCTKVRDLKPLKTHSSLKSLNLLDCQGLNLQKAKALSAKLPACRIEVPSGRTTLQEGNPVIEND